MRTTTQRKIILDYLAKTKRPKSASMIFEDLPLDSMNLSTIYRILETFFSRGIVSKSTMNNTNYFYMNQKEHNHYMICTKCQKMYEIGCHFDVLTSKIAIKNNFIITHHDMTVYGICTDCQ